MQIELLGIIALICGVLSWLFGGNFPAYLLFISRVSGQPRPLFCPHWVTLIFSRRICFWDF